MSSYISEPILYYFDLKKGIKISFFFLHKFLYFVAFNLTTQYVRILSENFKKN